MKVCVPTNRHNDILRDPVAGFPFSWLEGIQLVRDVYDADAIFIDFGVQPYTGEVRTLADAVFQEKWFRDLSHKVVWLSICDYPWFSQACKSGIKFVLSPLPDKQRNIECNVHPMPLHLCHNDHVIQMDRDYTNACRVRRKMYDFGFAGNVSGGIAQSFFGGRKWLEAVKDKMGPRMFLRDRAGWACSKTWITDHREWMQRMAECRYGFAPAGASNGPRAWWLMQVGCVPIFMDVEHLPFEDEVDWSKLAVFVPSDQKETFDYDSLPAGDEYEQLRANCIAFWDDYCWMPYLAKRMEETICGYLSRARQDSSLITSLSTYFATPKRR